MESLEAGTTLESEYQVFLNFRGPDTRNEFTDFLYHSLIDAGIRVFRDDEELRLGERIDEALQRAINNARIYIPIFSPTYASSKWCLRELTQIMGNTKSNGNKEILPIFFKVEPKDVKMKDGLYHNAILNLECENRASTEQVDSWRKALTEVAAIKGREVKPGDSQAKLIKLVIEDIVVKLKIKQESVTEHLIGINDRVIEVRNLLDIDSGGVRLIRIHGMGGIGKTTLAKVVFNELSTHFGKCCCFLENVRENSSRTDGLVKLQNKLLSEIGNAIGIGSIDKTEHLMKRIKGTLRDKKVLIVLDDVDNNEQVEKLIGKGPLCSGSRILITTRNKDVLQSIGPKYEMLPPYKMKVMSGDDALQLFNRHAFEKDSPSNDYYDISKEIVYATGRLPLTIVVIGSLLKNKSQEQWKEKLDELRKAPPQGVFQVLKVSYDALSFEQQQIFLDIACFFIGEKKTNAIYMWEACKLFPLSGIEVLKNKSLIKIGGGKEFLMHDQLRDLGRGIVHNENLMNPEERSRLWIENEILDTIKTKKMKNVQAMVLKLFPTKVHIKSEEIGRFEKLRFLTLLGGTFVGDLMDCFPKLRWIHWHAFTSKSELTNMCLKSVVVLEFSSVDGMDDMKLWQLIKEARDLKVLKLTRCPNITRTPDLSGYSTLERLSFSYCYGLRQIDGSIGKLKHLIELTFDGCPLLSLPEEIKDLQNLEHFTLKGCSQIKELPDSIFKWKSLRVLELSRLASTVRSFHANCRRQLPSEIGLLSQLQRLVLRDIYEIRELSALSISLTHLEVSSMSLQVVPDLSNLTNLVNLDLRDGSAFDYGKREIILTGELRWIGRLSKLKKLRLCLFNVPAPIELASLPRLSRLHLSSLNLQPLMQVPSSLLKLTLDKFNSNACPMQEIILNGLKLPNLTVLCVAESGPLKRFMLSSMRKLKRVHIYKCPKLDEIHIAGVLESLETLRICGCESFRRFEYDDGHWETSHKSSLVLASRVFNKLRYLELIPGDKILDIQFVGMSESFEELFLGGNHCQSFGGLSNLKNLKSLRIHSGPELWIVEGLNKLPNDCSLCISRCPKLLGVKKEFKGSVQSFKRYKEEESERAASTDPLMVWRAESSTQEWMHVPGTMEEHKDPFEEGESASTASTDLSMFWHPSLVSHAESSAQEQMRVPGKTEELLTPFEYSS